MNLNMSSQNTTTDNQSISSRTRLSFGQVKRPRLWQREIEKNIIDLMTDDEDYKKASSSHQTQKSNKYKEESGSESTDEAESKEFTPKQTTKVLTPLPKDWCITKMSSSTYTCKWTVQNFNIFSCSNKETLSSSKFKIPQFANLECNLILHPNGHEKSCINNLCITLQCLAQTCLDIDCELMLLNSSGTKVTSNIKTQPCNKNFSNSKTCYCVPKTKLNLLLPNDVLIIVCSLSVNDCINKTSIDNKYRAQEMLNQLELLSDLYVFTKKKDFCDVILCVEDQQFFAHRTILAARSSFFAVMFDHFKGKEINTFSIDNIKPRDFEKVLRFMYTGQILDIKNSVKMLIEAACNFSLSDLKIRCEKYLIENLSLDNILQNLILAEQLHANELKKKAKHFIVAFSSQIVNSPAFEAVKNISFDLYREILCLVLNIDDDM